MISDGIFQALICDLIVLPEYQGRGIGGVMLTQLLLHCEYEEIVMVQLAYIDNCLCPILNIS
nr:GNAT family N-acetyltransferase [Paenibacillus glacialis]